MLDPAEFFLVARFLTKTDLDTLATDARLRRAISTAYYGLFHFVLRAAAERFFGAGGEATAGYAVLYRSFDHGRMKEVCEALRGPKLSPKWAELFGRPRADNNLREFAYAFGVLQGQRHVADYHPTATFQRSQVSQVIDGAVLATSYFASIPADEKADFLALLMFKSRI